MKKNKIRLIALFLLVVLTIVIILLIGSRTSLKGPESIAFDPSNGRFLISNTLGKNILSQDAGGKLSVFMDKAFKAPKGILVDLPYLYVADMDILHIIDIPSVKIVSSVKIEGALNLNDIAIDDKGLIYITDTTANSIFLYDSKKQSQTVIKNALLTAPNGIVFDAPRKQMLIVCFMDKSPIISLNTNTRKVEVFMNTVYNELDGIAIDELGRIYFSSWKERAIFVIPQEQNRYEVFRRDLRSPADIYYHQADSKLMVPLWEKNKVVSFPLN